MALLDGALHLSRAQVLSVRVLAVLLALHGRQMPLQLQQHLARTDTMPLAVDVVASHMTASECLGT